MNQQPAIHLDGVSLRRGEKWILRNINWSVPRGACAAILGPNGSGKSTLTRILACYFWPTEGECSILGSTFGDVSLPNVRRSLRLLQPAGPYDIDPELTARQVVLTGFFGTIGLYETPTREMEREADEVLEQVGLSHIASHVYSTMSSGERVRSLIARALVQEPKLLLFDEPTAGLDLLAREQILATIQALSQEPEPPTIVMITHHIEELPPATSHVLVLSDGQAAAMGSPQDTLRPEILSQVYKCPVQVRQASGRFYLEVHPDAWKGLLHRR